MAGSTFTLAGANHLNFLLLRLPPISLVPKQLLPSTTPALQIASSAARPVCVVVGKQLEPLSYCNC